MLATGCQLRRACGLKLLLHFITPFPGALFLRFEASQLESLVIEWVSKVSQKQKYVIFTFLFYPHVTDPSNCLAVDFTGSLIKACNGLVRLTGDFLTLGG